MFAEKSRLPSWGTVSLIVADNLTAINGNSRYVPVDSQIYLEKGSQINAAGQHVDNSIVANGSGSRRQLLTLPAVRFRY